MRGLIMFQDFMSLLQSGGRACVAGSCFRTSCLSYRVEDGHAWPDHVSGLHVSLSYRVEDGHAWPDHVSGLHVSITEWRTGMRGRIMFQDFMSLLQSGGRACVA